MSRFLIRSHALFLHIPRCGGSWIEQMLGEMNIMACRWTAHLPKSIPKRHPLIGHFNRERLAMVQHTVAFVRHPIALYESAWRWIRWAKRSGSPLRDYWTWHPYWWANELWVDNFNDWVCLMLEKRPLWATRMIEQYVGPEGGEFCDFVGRQETLENDLLMVLRWLGYKEEVERWEREGKRIERVNATPDEDRELTAWSRSLRADVERSERLLTQRFYGDNERRRWYGAMARRGNRMGAR